MPGGGPEQTAFGPAPHCRRRSRHVPTRSQHVVRSTGAGVGICN